MPYTLKQLFDESREKWGIKSQIMMFVEEANEASVEAMHLMRANKDTQESLINFAEELADLQFMIDEMVYYLKDTKVSNSTFFDLMVEFRRQKEIKLEYILLNYQQEKEKQK
jgi:hypothetical protein